MLIFQIAITTLVVVIFIFGLGMAYNMGMEYEDLEEAAKLSAIFTGIVSGIILTVGGLICLVIGVWGGFSG